MSIRIHKYLGYGLKFSDPCESAKDKFDPRLKLNPFAFQDMLDRNRERYTVDGAIAYGKLNDELDEGDATFANPKFFKNIPGYEKIPTSLTAHIHMIYNGDKAEGYVLLAPSLYLEWQRFDDTIDFYEYRVYNPEEDLSTVWKWLSHGIYPFVGFTNLKTGDRFPEKGDVDALLKAMPDKAENILSKYGFKSLADYEANTMPNVPGIIRSMCQFTGLFAEPNGWTALRPAIVTYWN